MARRAPLAFPWKLSERNANQTTSLRRCSGGYAHEPPAGRAVDVGGCIRMPEAEKNLREMLRGGRGRIRALRGELDTG
eukprot:2447564-Pyramimonas_sp.AAC.1